ncbi:MAG: DUF192 domain-containing protein [Elusimicrobia bacterium]|nr:DUF192 domain-containing protein [Elusimicrobiota bacterium]
MMLSGGAFAADAPAPVQMPLSAEISFKGGAKVQAEAVWTAEHMTRGLMGVKNLPKGRGMIFIYPQEGVRRFWMKNMLIDLDILYLGHDGALRRVFSSVPHPAPGAADADVAVVEASGVYVLEVPAGFAAENSISAGSRADIAFSSSPVPSLLPEARPSKTAVSQPAQTSTPASPKPAAAKKRKK